MGVRTKVCLWLLAGLLGAPAYCQKADDKFHYLPELDIVELSPQMRKEPLSAVLYSIKTDILAIFLENILLFDSVDQYQTLPYIVSFQEQRNIGAAGDIAYTKGINVKNDVAEFSLLAPGRILTHPETGEELGMQAFIIGRAVVEKFADPQTVKINQVSEVAEINTRLVPLVGLDLPAIVDVRYPTKVMSGYILAVQHDHLLGGEYMPVVISLGKRDGIKQGHVLNIVDPKITKVDPNTQVDVKMPKVKVGEVMVYKPGDKISLAIITTSNRVIIPNDRLEVTELDF